MITENHIKYKIAKIIGFSYCYMDDPTYEDLLGAIYENDYRTVLKCPLNMFILGIVESFKTQDLEHANRILSALKEVVEEALEMSGTELSYIDEDWKDLRLLPNPSIYGSKWLLSKNDEIEGKIPSRKNYMSEFFEL